MIVLWPDIDAVGRHSFSYWAVAILFGWSFLFLCATMMELVIARFFKLCAAECHLSCNGKCFNGEKYFQAQSFINLAFSLTPLMAY